jgi:hypothetical protein
VSIYYARLPNIYLSEIAEYGTEYKNHATPLDKPVTLHRSKKFHLRNTEERVELFHLVAKLLWYLISGRSHAGFLHNYPDNPIHGVGRIPLEDEEIDDNIPVEPEQNEEFDPNVSITSSLSAKVESDPD